jgi:putative hydrolase of the HAD superfamily
MPTKLKAVLFDVDDTLCPTTEFAQLARRNAVKAMVSAGLELSEDEVAGELDEVISEFSSNYEHHFDKLLLRLPSTAFKHGNRALVIAAGVVAYHNTKFLELRPFPGVHELLSELRAAHLRLGIITHGWSVKQAEKLIRLDLVRFLDPDAIFISDEIGISKPNPKIYARAVRSLGLAPEEVMYVGDSPINDIAPPRQVGMVTVWARKASKQLESPVEPHHEIWTFSDLRRILSTSYGISLGSAPGVPGPP